MNIKAGICVYCGNPIRNGRSDKKFCDSSCKDGYYNKMKVQENREVNRILNILKKNRRALVKLFNPRKPDQLFTREDLIKAGFEFGFSTHTVVTKTKSSEITFCLDYGYRQLIDGTYKIFPTFGRVQINENGLFVLENPVQSQ